MPCSDVDFSIFGPNVFKLLKLYFQKHHGGHGRCVLDTTPEEASRVAEKTGMQLYKNRQYFTVDDVNVTHEEHVSLLQQLHAKVEEIVRDAPYPTDRLLLPGSHHFVCSSFSGPLTYELHCLLIFFAHKPYW